MFETPVTIVGFVLTEPTTHALRNGHRVTRFRLAATARRFDRTAQEWVDGDRVVATVKCWTRMADRVAGEVRKGDPLLVNGRLSTREHESGGQRRLIVEVQADALGVDLGQRRDTAQPAPQEVVEAGRPAPPPGGLESAA